MTERQAQYEAEMQRAIRKGSDHLRFWVFRNSEEILPGVRFSGTTEVVAISEIRARIVLKDEYPGWTFDFVRQSAVRFR